ncbi:MAG: SUMF1/EgtB/PvdO family nonheme iron enzyme [Puniceicoccaceae bacterium]
MNCVKLLLAAGLLIPAIVGRAITIETVFVGNAGNDDSISTGFGAVPYDYYIGTYEVTNAQYAAFLNSVAKSDPHGLWSELMGNNVMGGISRSGSAGEFTYTIRTGTEGINNGQSMGDRPVNYVNFWSAARFANWITSGDTEVGVYMQWRLVKRFFGVLHLFGKSLGMPLLTLTKRHWRLTPMALS